MRDRGSRGMLQRRDSVSRIGFKIKIVGLLAIVLATLSIAFSLWTCQQQRDRTEAEILDQSRMLAVEMDAVWEFVSVNQGIINYAADGTYDYKGLHCAVAGKSVAALFGRHSDDIIRFTKLEPRNPSNSPDVFETEALLAFEEGASEYYGFTEWKGKPVFRYVRSMRVTKHCVECHGQPAGELDPLGHPKEGWSIGDSGGGMSIIIPTDLYYDSMQRSVTDNILFFLAIMACLAVTIYFALNKMVTHPLARLGENLALIDRNPSDDVRLEKVESMYGSRETDVLFDRFNSMSSTLTVLYRDLEGQVKDRTEQLAEANRQLEEQRSQLERVNERLKQESQYKSDFLAIVSHELRTPLTSILAFTELLVDHVPAEGARMRRQLDEVEKNGQTLLEMVNNILETARIQAGSEKLNLELVDVADVVSMVESSSRPLADKRGIDLSSSVNPSVPLIMSDWEKVRRILMNLVSNAVKFTDSGGWVRIGVEYDEGADEVLITVRDNGIGIPRDKHDLVFERFTQENMSTVRSYGGSGLGLSLVRDLCGMLGGRVGLESDRGCGSAFTVALPVAGPPAVEDAQDIGAQDRALADSAAPAPASEAAEGPDASEAAEPVSASGAPLHEEGESEGGAYGQDHARR